MVKTEVKVKTSAGNVTLKMKFDTMKHTVYDIKKEYCDNHNPSKTPEKITFRMRGKELKPDSQTLHKCGIRGRITMVTMTSKLRGGAQQEEKGGGHILNNNRYRKLDKSDPEIKLTNKACCVYHDKKEDRAQMPCGCGYSSKAMFNTLRAVLINNEYEYIIKCAGCRVELDFELCAKIADLNDPEYVYFLEELDKRASPETQPCPDCGIDCERPEKLTMFRVNCTSCSGGDWCFLCAQKWSAGGFTVCGNKNCELYDINDILKECPMKQATNGVNIPEVRACPNCLDFIEHDEACKHMTCEKCGHKFCFACLKPQKDGKWQCGSYMDQCNVAPRQQF